MAGAGTGSVCLCLCIALAATEGGVYLTWPCITREHRLMAAVACAVSGALCSDVAGRAQRQERGQKWSAELEVQLCYEIKTFLLAGHETSAAMLTWTLYQLTQHPDCLAKARSCSGERTRSLLVDRGRSLLGGSKHSVRSPFAGRRLV